MYNDADILEKILKDKRKEMGPSPEEEDVGSPKLKLSKFDHISDLILIFWPVCSKSDTLPVTADYFLKHTTM